MILMFQVGAPVNPYPLNYTPARIGTEKPWQPETWQDFTQISLPGTFAIFSRFSGHFLTEVHIKPGEKKEINPLEKISKNPVETAGRNCRFLSLVVVEPVLTEPVATLIPKTIFHVTEMRFSNKIKPKTFSNVILWIRNEDVICNYRKLILDDLAFFSCFVS